jgi:Zn-dependent peptidase ImmA (M78 family)
MRLQFAEYDAYAFPQHSKSALTYLEDGVLLVTVCHCVPKRWQRVLAARQLGHALLHLGYPDDRYRLPGDPSPSAAARRAEADVFASELLLPQSCQPTRERLEMVAAGKPGSHHLVSLAASALDSPSDWLVRHIRRLAAAPPTT